LFVETCRDFGAIPSTWLLGATFDLFDAVKLNGNIDLEDITVRCKDESKHHKEK